MKSGNAVIPGKSRESDILEPSSSELREEVPLLALSDLPLALSFSVVDTSLDGSGSGGVPTDCCLRLRYSDIDSCEKRSQVWYFSLS